MEWSNFSIKILGINFDNFISDNSNWDKASVNIAKKSIFGVEWDSLWGKKLIINQISLSKLWCIGQIYTIPKYIKKEIEKRIYDFLWEGKRIHPGHLVQLPIWKGGLGGIVDIDTQLNYLKIKWIQRLFHPTNALWKDLMLYRLNLILNSNQGLALFRQNQILRSTRQQTYIIIIMKIFLYNSSTPGCISRMIPSLLLRLLRKF